VDVEIRISGGDEIAEYAVLAKVLNGDRELAGRVRTVMSPPAEGELGGVVDVLVVALGSGVSAQTGRSRSCGPSRTR
jgi:hypothetical protein